MINKKRRDDFEGCIVCDENRNHYDGGRCVDGVQALMFQPPPSCCVKTTNLKNKNIEKTLNKDIQSSNILTASKRTQERKVGMG